MTTPPAAPGPAPEKAKPPHPRRWLLDALGHDPLSLDALVARTGRPAHDLAAHLLELEMDGLIARLPGQVFQRRGRG